MIEILVNVRSYSSPLQLGEPVYRSTWYTAGGWWTTRFCTCILNIAHFFKNSTLFYSFLGHLLHDRTNNDYQMGPNFF